LNQFAKHQLLLLVQEHNADLRPVQKLLVFVLQVILRDSLCMVPLGYSKGPVDCLQLKHMQSLDFVLQDLARQMFLILLQLYFEGDEHYDFFVKPSLILKLDEKDGIKYSEFDFVIFTP